MPNSGEQLSVDQVIKAWTNQTDSLPAQRREQVEQWQQLNDGMLKVLAQGVPVSTAILEERLGLDSEDAQFVFRELKKRGAAEFDDEGNLVGLALSLIPSKHRMKFPERDLFAWCSLDTLFLPGLLGKRAEVESTCPVTGVEIKLVVGPEGVGSYSPPGLVLSIAVPGISCHRPDSPRKQGVGPESETCSQMHFFTDREAAETWVADYPGVAILTVEEAYRLAEANWLSRRN